MVSLSWDSNPEYADVNCSGERGRGRSPGFWDDDSGCGGRGGHQTAGWIQVRLGVFENPNL